MHELHLRYLEARRVREATLPGSAEITFRAQELARRHARARAGPPGRGGRPRLTVVRARQAPAEPAGV